MTVDRTPGGPHHIAWVHDPVQGRVEGLMSCTSDADGSCRTWCERHWDTEDDVPCAIRDRDVVDRGCLLSSGGPCCDVVALEEYGPSAETYAGVDRSVRDGQILIGRFAGRGELRWCYAECAETHHAEEGKS